MMGGRPEMVSRGPYIPCSLIIYSSHLEKGFVWALSESSNMSKAPSRDVSLVQVTTEGLQMCTPSHMVGLAMNASYTCGDDLQRFQVCLRSAHYGQTILK